LENLSASDPVPAVRKQAYILLRSSDPEARKLLNSNPSFEFAGATADKADSWNLWLYNGLEMKRTGEVKKSGNYSIKAKGIQFGGVIQDLPVQAGVHELSFAYYSPAGSAGKGTIRLQIDFWDAQNNHIGTVRPYLETKRIADTAGEWSGLYWAGEFPEGIVRIEAYALLEGLNADQEVYIDDFYLNRLSPDPYANNPKTPLNLNPSFEIAGDTPANAEYWNEWLYNGLLMERSGEFKKSGDFSLKAAGVKFGGVIQEVAVQPGVHGISASYYSPQSSAGPGTIRLQLDLYDAQNNHLYNITPTSKQIANTAGEWTTLEWEGQLPANVSRVTVYALLENMDDSQQIYLDDFSFFRLSP
jgi:hypothetical protein